MIGQQIRQERLRLGLSQEQLAFRAKLSRNYLSILELDQKSPTLTVYFRICRALGVKPSALLRRIED